MCHEENERIYMLIKLYSAALVGVTPIKIEVEIDYSREAGNKIYIVGMSEKSVTDIRRRILTALKNEDMPIIDKNLIINIAPADLKKEGAMFDAPIALAIALLRNHITASSELINNTIFLGELSLEGDMRPIKGALPIALDAQRLGIQRIVLPLENARECRLVDGVEILGVSTLHELFLFVSGRKQLINARELKGAIESNKEAKLDFKEVKGQHQAKRALQIAAAGRHNIIFVGPPGSGKTMLAKRVSSIMPPMTINEIFETSKIYSIGGRLDNGKLITQRPFRDPHHTCTSIGLMGGGVSVQPGEISLAHNGILFLDELTEFNRSTIENLRQPLEEREVRISRSHANYTFPASFLLIAALNPCPCGYYNITIKKCTCNARMIHNYLNRISGPLLDRIDLQISVNAVEYEDLKNKDQETSSADLYKDILVAQQRQLQRFGKLAYNAHMNSKDIEAYCQLNEESETIMQFAFKKMNLSLRSYHKILKLARTIADLADSETIQTNHLKEALMYRSLEKSIQR